MDREVKAAIKGEMLSQVMMAYLIKQGVINKDDYLSYLQKIMFSTLKQVGQDEYVQYVAKEAFKEHMQFIENVD